jgi:hypothetical protein
VEIPSQDLNTTVGPSSPSKFKHSWDRWLPGAGPSCPRRGRRRALTSQQVYLPPSTPGVHRHCAVFVGGWLVGLNGAAAVFD